MDSMEASSEGKAKSEGINERINGQEAVEVTRAQGHVEPFIGAGAKSLKRDKQSKTLKHLTTT